MNKNPKLVLSSIVAVAISALPNALSAQTWPDIGTPTDKGTEFILHDKRVIIQTYSNGTDTYFALTLKCYGVTQDEPFAFHGLGKWYVVTNGKTFQYTAGIDPGAENIPDCTYDD